MKKLRIVAKWLSIALASFISVFLLLAVLIYIPAIQNFVVRQVTQSLSESTGMNISIHHIRLVFPLDLSVEKILVTEKADTILRAKSLQLDVKLWPLLKGRADVDGVTLRDVQLNTKNLISDTQVQGSAQLLSASSHGVDWKHEQIRLNKVRLEKADLYVTLSDTAQKDTSSTPVNWNIGLDRADIIHSQIHLSMPGDSMRIYTDIGRLGLRQGRFDLGQSYYGFKTLDIHQTALRYDLPLETPVQGLDVNHLALTGLNLAVDTLSYTAAGTLHAGIRKVQFKEKSGFEIRSLTGNLLLDNRKIVMPDLKLATPYSDVTANVRLDFRALEAHQGGNILARLEARLGSEDIRILGKAYADEAYFKQMPQQPTRLKADISGNIDRLNLNEVYAQMPQVLTLTADGTASQLADARRSGQFNIKLDTHNLTLLRGIMNKSLGAGFSVPDSLRAKGNLGFEGENYHTDIHIASRKGQMQTKARFNPSSEAYSLQTDIQNFPLSAFVTDMPLGNLTGRIQASGRGFDPMSVRTALKADVHIDQFRYGPYDLDHIDLTADYNRNIAQADFNAHNSLVQAEGNLTATLSRKHYDVSLDTRMARLNMKQLGVAADTFYFGSDLNLQAQANADLTEFRLKGGARHNRFTTSTRSSMARDILFDLGSNRDTTTADISAGDLVLQLGAQGDVDQISRQATAFAKELTAQMEQKVINQEVLKQKLPTLDLRLKVGRRNPVYNLLRLKGYDFTNGNLQMTSNPDRGLSGKGYLGGLRIGGLLLDTLNTHIVQDSTGVNMYARVKNDKKNPTPLELIMKSYILQDGGGIRLIHLDQNRKRGLDLEMQATLRNGGLNIHLSPDDPIVAYRKIKLNPDNYITLSKDNSIDANVKMVADDGTGLQLYSYKQDSINDLTLNLHRINLKELSQAIPYLPQFKGFLNGDIHMTNDIANKKFTAMASVNVAGFNYENVPLGDLSMDAIYMPESGGKHQVSAFINSNGKDVLDFNGAYFSQNEGYLNGEAHLTQFPLQLLNGFMTGTDMAMKGNAQGSLKVEGPISQPILNGSLDLDGAHMYSDVYGVDFRTEKRALEIKDSRILFDQYNLYSTGKNPLVLNGYFDMSDFSKMKMDFKMRANDFELINTQKKKESMVYGKVYANFIGSLRGTTDDITIRGSLDVLDRTDMTYILKDSPLSVDNRLNDLVEFVNFEDSTKNQQGKPAPEGSFDLTLGITINDAAQFHCMLSEDGQSYVNLEGGGDLTLRMTQQGEMRMTGRFTTNRGDMKYALPVIPLKEFHLVQGSYVEFTGDIMNPTLNIAAKERTKAVVTENDRQRSVAFDVGVAITKPLNDMGLEFTIESPEDLAIQNELASMSKEQRGKAAVTLMATGMYMTDETMMSGGGFKANNALNAFLQSEIQNIAGSALKTIDINFGIENNTSQTGTTTTDYSFQFAKRFWNNRISVIVGGKVSTGADARNDAESFINNISVEYRLDQSATRYIRLFYDRNSVDPLEGLLTKTGAGLVLRRKTDKLGELFIFKKKKDDKIKQNDTKK